MRRPALTYSSIAAASLVLATCTAPPPSNSLGTGTPYSSASLAHLPVGSARIAGNAPLRVDVDANEMVDQYCTRCHNERRRRGDLVLEGFDLGQASDNGPVVEKMIRKLRVGMMPPSGANRPAPEEMEALIEELESTMDRLAEEHPNPGRRTFQRLNRAEYKKAVEGLLGIEVDVSTFLPLDTKSANFDNIADVQMPSATVMEGYLRAAGHISRLALGDPDAEIGSSIYRVPRIASQKERVEGAPIGTRGGLSVVHNFPADGTYVFHLMPYAAVEGEVFGRPHGTEQIEVSIEGERVALLTVDRWMSESEPTGLNIRTDSIHVTAGPKRVTVAFLRKFEGPVDDLIRPIDHTLADGQIGIGLGVTTQQHLQRVTILGPFDVTGVSETPTRRRIFTCRPTAPDEERPCAEQIVARLATDAYRRTTNDGDIVDLMAFYDQGAEEGGFEGGIRTALQAILASPHFLFRLERRPSDVQAGEAYEINDMDLASRLSFFIWGAPPDDALIEIAERDGLNDTDELEKQTRRLLADPRAEALATRFASQWLRLQDLEKVHPDALTFPYFDQTLADAMTRETELLFAHLVSQDRPVLELLTADYTFVNERLARHYGITGVQGTEFERVSYPDDKRRGLLGHGSVLTLTSHPDRTSPVLRGKWVLEVLMGSPPPPPPPDVPPFEETDADDAGRFLTVRERMEQHRANPACNSCHSVMDPIGLALENFDPTGAWRTRDEGNPVDPVGELFDGTSLAGPADLRNALQERPEVFLRIFTENMMAYALGRRLEFYDMPTVRAIVREAGESKHKLSSYVLGVVKSPAFRTAIASEAATDEQEAKN
jgi:hypothetical protein